MLQLTHAACVLAAPAVLVFRASRWLSAPRCPVQATRGQRRRAAPALWGSGAGPPPRPAGQGRLMSAASSFAAPRLKWRRLDDAGQHSLGLAETASSSSGDDDDEQPPPGALASGGADPVPRAAATALGAGDQPPAAAYRSALAVQGDATGDESGGGSGGDGSARAARAPLLQSCSPLEPGLCL